MTRRMPATAAVLLLCLAAALRLDAQVPVTVRGTVETADGVPVPQARVVVQALPGGDRASARTDARGAFAVRGLPHAAAYAVNVTADGHHPLDLTLPGAPATGARLVLERPVVPLAPLAVAGSGAAALRGIAGASLVIERAELRTQRPAAAHEALARIAGVHVQEEDALGLHLNIGIRGMDPRRSSRVLLLEDGVPIHLGPYTDPTAHYQPPAETLQRIEVLKGAAQVAYGPQTVGGVINYVRRPPPASPGGAILVRVGERGRVGGHALVGTGFGSHSASLSLGRRHADGPRRGARHEVDDASLMLRLDLAAAGSLLVKAGTYAERSRWGESGLTQAEFEADPFHNPSPGDVFDLTRRVGQLVHRVRVGPGMELVSVAYAQDLHRTSWRQASSSSDRFGASGYAQAFGCAPDAASIADCGFQGRPRHYRFAGLEPRLRLDAGGVVLETGTRIHVEEAERRQFLGTTPRDVTGEPARDNVLTATAWSAFAHARLSRGGWTASPGLRLEHVRSTNRNRLRGLAAGTRYSQLLPGVGLTREFAAATIFAGVHRGFAPPRPADVLSPQPGQSLVQVEPELSWNHEFGVRARLPLAVIAEATLFRTDFANQVIEGARTGSGHRFVNAGTTLHQGLELHLALAPPRTGGRTLRPVAEVSWTYLPDARYTSHETSSVDGTTSIRGNRLPFAPRHMVHAAAGAALPGFSIVLRGSRVAEQYADDLNTRTPSPDGQQGLLPACTLLGATANRMVANGRATVFATADNIGNRVCITERVEGIIVGSPRRLAVGLEWVF